MKKAKDDFCGRIIKLFCKNFDVVNRVYLKELEEHKQGFCIVCGIKNQIEVKKCLCVFNCKQCGKLQFKMYDCQYIEDCYKPNEQLEMDLNTLFN